MTIRATKKLLNISRIEPLKYMDESEAPFPGEWYAGLVSTGSQGKMLIHFLFNDTLLSSKGSGRYEKPTNILGRLANE